MRVVKLGGSLFEHTRHTAFACLAHIMRQAIPTVVVCGGGCFAESVRAAQKKWYFSDATAHEMAILAMQQTAIMSQSLFPAFTLCTEPLYDQKKPLAIWLPTISSLNADSVPASWEVTSDSLAAWLAAKMQATQLQVIKACEVGKAATLDELAQKGIVDAQFLYFAQKASCEVTVVNVEVFLAQ